MFLISLLPDWVFYALLLVSAITLLMSTLFSAIPFIGRYAKLIQVVSAIVLVVSTYIAGAISNQAEWQTKILEQSVEIAELKAREAVVTTEVVTKYIDKIRIIKEKGNEIIKYITTESDNKCDLPNSFSVLHNAAAKNELPDPAGATDATTSSIKLSEATTTIIENYGVCALNAQQVIGLQDWIREQQRLNP